MQLKHCRQEDPLRSHSLVSAIVCLFVCRKWISFTLILKIFVSDGHIDDNFWEKTIFFLPQPGWGKNFSLNIWQFIYVTKIQFMAVFPYLWSLNPFQRREGLRDSLFSFCSHKGQLRGHIINLQRKHYYTKFSGTTILMSTKSHAFVNLWLASVNRNCIMYPSAISAKCLWRMHVPSTVTTLRCCVLLLM